MGSRKFSRKWLVGLAAFVVAVGLLLWAYAGVLDKPVEGTIIQAKQPAPQAPAPAFSQLETPYYTTKYPRRYDKAPSPTNTASLDAEVLVAHQDARYGTGSRVTVTVAALPAAGVTDDSAYKLYASQPATYSLKNQQFGDDAGYTAARLIPTYQETLLWPHAGKLLTITMTSAAQSPLIDSDVQTIVTSLQWR